MSMTCGRIAASVLFLLAGPSAFAAESRAPTLTLEQILALARQRSPALAAGRARVEEARGVALQRSRLPDPDLTLAGARGSARAGTEEGTESGFDLAQTVPAPWGGRARREVGSASVAAAEEDLRATTADTLFEAKRLFYGVALAEAEASALADAARDSAALRNLVARRVEVGESPEAERLRAHVEALRADLAARAAAQQVTTAKAALDRFLLGSLGSDFVLVADLDPARLDPLPADTVGGAMDTNADLRAARATISAKRALLSVERAARVPALRFSVFHDVEIDKEATGATAGLTLPLWNRNAGAIRAAAGRLAEAEAIETGERVRVEQELERLVGRDRISRETALTYAREIVPASREALGAVTAGLEQGETSLLDWLEARRSYSETLRAYHDAQRSAFLTRAELERLVGDPHAEDR